jgi:hypothetical protein
MPEWKSSKSASNWPSSATGDRLRPLPPVPGSGRVWILSQPTVGRSGLGLSCGVAFPIIGRLLPRALSVVPGDTDANAFQVGVPASDKHLPHDLAVSAPLHRSTVTARSVGRRRTAPGIAVAMQPAAMPYLLR